MRKLITTAAAMLVLSATAAIAQGGGGAPGGGQGRGGAGQMQALMAGITLSAEQQIKVDTIAKKYTDLNAALRADQTLDQTARRAKSTENNTKRNDEIKAVLTAEQKTVFDKNVADMAARMQGGGRPPQA